MIVYENKDNKCECSDCELKHDCLHKNAFRRLPRECGGLGLCPKIGKEVKHDD